MKFIEERIANAASNTELDDIKDLITSVPYKRMMAILDGITEAESVSFYHMSNDHHVEVGKHWGIPVKRLVERVTTETIIGTFDWGGEVFITPDAVIMSEDPIQQREDKEIKMASLQIRTKERREAMDRFTEEKMIKYTVTDKDYSTKEGTTKARLLKAIEDKKKVLNQELVEEAIQCLEELENKTRDISRRVVLRDLSTTSFTVNGVKYDRLNNLEAILEYNPAMKDFLSSEEKAKRESEEVNQLITFIKEEGLEEHLNVETYDDASGMLGTIVLISVKGVFLDTDLPLEENKEKVRAIKNDEN